MRLKYLLDTHALVWAVLNPERLGAKAARILTSHPPSEIGVCNASVIELGRLVHGDVLDFIGRPSDVFGPALARFAAIPVPFEAAVAAPAIGLPHQDPYDRLIVATAIVLNVPLITKDGKIVDSGLVRTLW